MATNGNPNELTPRQRRAIAALLTETDVKAAAHAAGLGERTLYRWLAEDANFRQALTAAEGETIDAACRRLLAGQEQALWTLESVMTSAKKDSDRRLAAVAWLDLVLRWRELRTLEERLTALEAAVNGKS